MNQTLKLLLANIETSVDLAAKLAYHDRLSLPSEAQGGGIYIFSHNEQIQYVGRANCIRQRVQQHSRPSSGHNTASFAYLKAKKAHGVLRASYRKEGSREHLMQDKDFLARFAAAKIEISTMRIQFIVEEDPITQALLEILIAANYKAPFNDFDNH